jgi:hypothetical protein
MSLFLKNTLACLIFFVLLSTKVQACDMNPKTVVTQLMADYSTQSAAGVLSHYHEKAEIYDGAFDSTYRGIESIKKDVIAVFLSIIPDLTWKKAEGTKTSVSDASVFIEWELSGSPSRELIAVPENLQGPFKIRGFSVFEVDRSSCKIKSQRDFYNAPTFFNYL